LDKPEAIALLCTCAATIGGIHTSRILITAARKLDKKPTYIAAIAKAVYKAQPDALSKLVVSVSSPESLKAVFTEAPMNKLNDYIGFALEYGDIKSKTVTLAEIFKNYPKQITAILENKKVKGKGELLVAVARAVKDNKASLKLIVEKFEDSQSTYDLASYTELVYDLGKKISDRELFNIAIAAPINLPLDQQGANFLKEVYNKSTSQSSKLSLADAFAGTEQDPQGLWGKIVSTGATGTTTPA